ncbi:GntR family transcriptional regulator [Micromonospora craniellae]|uniref:GntR family transcriptional regulator n=1 Tax=Micromonospora craniellae TaxID=2294034 RepID=A0A372FXL8_9ACTN|nr:GntR family transcriptional regulator [Micromonospora craniellae]QOC91533.1 GntR family transcriptional regulator [Micromonospora craniellae]RFS45483.1 GntR family transcriptional regulator [Micromonospora craniellae]
MAQPRYRQIASELRDQITSGALREGDRLPTEPQLQERYRASRNTVRDATALLVNEGLVQRVPGRGGGMIVRRRVTLTFHAHRAEMPARPTAETDAWRSEVVAQGYEASQDFSLTIKSLSSDLAERLHVEPDSGAVLRRCVRYVNGQPSSLQDTYYPIDLAEEIRELLSPKDIPQGTTKLLADRGHEQVAYYDEYISRMPTPEETNLLGLQPGTAILLHIRTGYTEHRPIRVSFNIFAGDRNQIVTTHGDTRIIAKFRPAEAPE